ncbi:MAG: NAD(P)-dependent oxidoreductase, partial [Candidatus Daviesbacteria bacterium]|nr:NAD(P)-dependent oxidoreductase [Candidatus Daviesbacteria bacterium]
MNSLSRNAPIAYVIGAAGFIGSHIVKSLLVKEIQVIGVDDLSTGLLTNLSDVSQNQNFHFIQAVSGHWNLPDVPRLDYALFLIADDIPKHEYLRTLDNFTNHVKSFTPKILLGSDLGLYEKEHNLGNLSLAEKQLAEIAAERKSNIRVVRLAGVYGPRMHFRRDDPLFRLIKAAVLNQVQEMNVALDFGSRDLDIDDAVTLLVKALMHGGTAHKIYDGALLHPLKVAELKQVLVDPLWHERMAFEPTKLPAWPSPNLEKTEDELSFKPKAGVVNSLKETLHFFRDHPEYLKKEDSKEGSVEVKETKPEVDKKDPQDKVVESSSGPSKFWGNLLKLLVLGLVVGGLVIPFFATIYSGWKAQNYMNATIQALTLGEVEEAKNQAEGGLIEVTSLESRLATLKLLSLDNVSLFASASQYLALSKVAALGLKDLSDGINYYFESFKSLTGESEVEVKVLVAQAKTSLDLANQKFGLVESSLDTQTINSKGGFLSGYFLKLQDGTKKALSQTQRYSNLVFFTSQLIVNPTSQSYLVALTDENILRPGFGKVVAVAQIDVEKGRIKKLETYSAEELTKTLAGKFQIPKDFTRELKGFELGIEDVAI